MLPRSTYRTRIGEFFAVLVLAVGAAAFATDSINADKTGLAIGGYDPVAYFTVGKPTKGDFQITAEHDGAVYRFATEQNRELFRQDPARYLPQFGNYCAYGVSMGKKFSADPTVWKIVDGRLYLNLDQNIAQKFSADLQGNIAKANENWKIIAEAPAR